MWLLIQMISTGNCLGKSPIKPTKPTKPALPFTFHIISHFEFDFFRHLEISQSTVSISSGPRGRRRSWRRPRPPPPAAPGRSPRGRCPPPRSAARCRRSRFCWPRRRAPSAAGAGPRRGDRGWPPGGCRCRLGGPRAAPGGHRWQGRGHNGDPKNRYRKA